MLNTKHLLDVPARSNHTTDPSVPLPLLIPDVHRLANIEVLRCTYLKTIDTSKGALVFVRLLDFALDDLSGRFLQKPLTRAPDLMVRVNVLGANHCKSSTSNPIARMNRLTLLRRSLAIAAGKLFATCTVSRTRSLMARTRRVCWSWFALTPMAAKSCQTYMSSPLLTLPGKM